MKFVIILSMFFISAYAHGNGHSMQGIPKFKVYYEECLLENGLSKEDLQQIRKHKHYHELGCLMSCMLAKFQLIDEEGNIIPEKVNKLMNDWIANLGAEFTDEKKEFAYTCANQVEKNNTDLCLKSFQYVTCIMQHFWATANN